MSRLQPVPSLHPAISFNPSFLRRARPRDGVGQEFSERAISAEAVDVS